MWEEAFTFLVHNPKTQELEVEVGDGGGGREGGGDGGGVDNYCDNSQTKENLSVDFFSICSLLPPCV